MWGSLPFSFLPWANMVILREILEPGLTLIFRDPNFVVVEGVWFDSSTMADEEEVDEEERER